MLDLNLLNTLNCRVTQKALLKDVTTFRLGGPCAALVECPTSDELVKAVIALRTHNIPFVLMGFGSNILASDKGTDHVVLRYTRTTPLIAREENRLIADAATQLDDLVAFAVDQGLDGLTSLSGIPGTVGGAVAGNAGAYGQQVSDRLTELQLLKPDGNVVTVSKETIAFQYRDSAIKHNGDIILSAVFALPPTDDNAVLAQARTDILTTRTGKHGSWKDIPSAGSFFRNVLPSSKAGQRESAGWFLEQAGCRTMKIGGAFPHPRHANILTHSPEGTADDVYALSLKMADAVKAEFGIELSREVRFLGPLGPDGIDTQGYW